MTTNVRTGLADLRKELESPKPDLERCKKLLVQLKIALTQLAGLQPAAELTADAVSELELARDVYETAVHLSILDEDIPSFERHVSLVKTYYFDYASVLPPSPRAGHLLGLNLMRLIAQNRIAEFHTELELVPTELRTDSHVAYALRLEQQLTDGAYATILSNAADVPDASFRFFMDTLCVTARKETADCAERAYEVLDKATLVRLLALKDPEEVDTLAMERGWVVSGDTVRFGGDDAGEAAVDLELSMDLIKRNMEYAKELERIV